MERSEDLPRGWRSSATTEGEIECAGLLVPDALMNVPLAGSGRGDEVVCVSSSICTKEQCRLGLPSAPEGVAMLWLDTFWLDTFRQEEIKHYAISEILNSFLCRHRYTP